ncbi:hypothetical protein [Microbacterium sp.]|uniref:hypothetical protein n=1 Tax=Microbacterium sp. TaxID=51671 RepID=UPI0039E3455F
MRLTTLIGLSTLVTAATGCTAASPEPEATPAILCEPATAHVSAREAAPGEIVTVTGTAWLPCELDPTPSPVTMEWIGFDRPIARAEVDAAGGFTMSLTVPDVGPGAAVIRVSSSTNEPVELPFTITE